MASELAQAVLSTDPPRVPGAEVYARCVPAHLAGGDFFTLAPRDGALWFAVGDVAGKGLPAAMIMTRAVTYPHLLANLASYQAIERDWH